MTVFLRFLFIFSGVVIVAPLAQANPWSLRVEVDRRGDTDLVPLVTASKIPGCCVVTFDPDLGHWQTPIVRSSNEFVTTYDTRLEHTANGEVSVKLRIPTSVIAANELVYLHEPTEAVSEQRIRRLWQDNRIASAASNARIQFGYLQDLIYIVDKLRSDESKLGGNRTAPTAAATRASFMLLRVVANLGLNTWFVIDPASRKNIDWAVDMLNRAKRTNNICRWLGEASCGTGDITGLVATVEMQDAVKAKRMYSLLVPDDARLDVAFCSLNTMDSMNGFVTYFSSLIVGSSAPDLRRISGISEVRIANDLAACTASRVLCGEVSGPKAEAEVHTAIERVTAAIRSVGSATMSAPASARRSELEEIAHSLAAGEPLFCNQR